MVVSKRMTMNEVLAELMLEGLTGLRQLRSGKHLRPEALALTIAAVALNPEQVAEIILDTAKQARWEAANATA